MLEKVKSNFQSNKISFILNSVAALVAIVTIIVYATTGIIKGFTDAYNPAVFVFLVLGLLLSLLNLYKKIDTVETFAFVCLFIAMVLFFVANANYIVAVTRAIDVTSVSGTFIFTVILCIVAWGTSLASLCFKTKKVN